MQDGYKWSSLQQHLKHLKPPLLSLLPQKQALEKHLRWEPNPHQASFNHLQAVLYNGEGLNQLEVN